LSGDLTPKAQQTRDHILSTALALFIANGYEATTMRDIAAAADCSLGLAYRYFSRKEELVLALYEQMVTEITAQIEHLPATALAVRFHVIMRDRLAAAEPYREALGALFGAAANPNSGVSVLGTAAEDLRERGHHAFVQLVTEASDAPPQTQIENVATLLYGLHFALILFWLYDRTPGQHATADLLGFTRDMLGVLRRVIILPPVSRTLARLARIAEGMFVRSHGRDGR
jgi:AcrR family transcriptional regulator